MYKVGPYILDSEQSAIIEDKSKYLLVVAGAGSGKTLTILGKIKYLLEKEKLAPDDILCISFTKKASLSLEEKIEKELNKKIKVYTFHKLALEILKDDHYNIADTSLLTDIINSFFRIEILNYPYLKQLVLKYYNSNNYDKLLIKEIPLLEKKIESFIHLFKCNGNTIINFKKYFNKIKYTLSYTKYKKEKIFLLIILNIYLMYNKYLEDNNELDFDDMIIKATSYLKENTYHNIKYIIIDEYQDTSLIRFNLIKELINKTNSNLMVVGDDFQSIYSFTG